jgi:hypothetical protein
MYEGALGGWPLPQLAGGLDDVLSKAGGGIS